MTTPGDLLTRIARIDSRIGELESAEAELAKLRAERREIVERLTPALDAFMADHDSASLIEPDGLTLLSVWRYGDGDVSVSTYEPASVHDVAWPDTNGKPSDTCPECDAQAGSHAGWCSTWGDTTQATRPSMANVPSNGGVIMAGAEGGGE